MNQPCVLIVDDEPALLRAMERLVEVSGCQVITASNGAEALQAMEGKRPDLIISDINMPQMNGYEFYRAVRARRDWTAIPFIFLTARDDWADILAGKAMGAEDYLTKPFRLVELQVIVKARLERAQAIREAARAEAEWLAREHPARGLRSHPPGHGSRAR